MRDAKCLIVEVKQQLRELILIPVISIESTTQRRVPVYWGYVTTPYLTLHMHSLLVSCLAIDPPKSANGSLDLSFDLPCSLTLESG